MECRTACSVQQPRIASPTGKRKRSNLLVIYAGGQTIWLGTQVNPKFNRSVSANASSTAPVIGGRIMAEFLQKWFLLLDGNVGGFGVDNVTFTSSALGAVGYHTTLFGVPSTVEAGYKSLNVWTSTRAAPPSMLPCTDPLSG
jgi:hypothetical protein